MDKLVKKYNKIFPEIKQLKISKGNNRKRFKAEYVLYGKNKKVYFGQIGAHTYYDGASKVKRDGYIARASKIKNKEGEICLQGTWYSCIIRLLYFMVRWIYSFIYRSLDL